ncbi:DEAD/DEAH box helicase family protein [Neorhizobium tomejilense]|uniref:DEAD/DEAH box helicase family protein n=1 Tax=Neorhizobium tomejilense TaxID=2093828 RepID=UPI001FE11DFE|nr:DEAD/DEAH box helicase family protein [Neorhizobium tomejilense]
MNFDDLLDDDEAPVTDPRDIFLTLDRDKRFSFPRDIQTEVMKAWYKLREQRDTFIKLNVGSGKTLVGLLLLQSSLNEGAGPALYICPDHQLVSQVTEEADALGLEVVDDPKDPAFAAGQKICVTTVHKLFNGRSVFGVETVKLNIGAVIVDDVHASIATIADQFRIKLPHTHEAYDKIVKIVASDLKKQSHSRFLSLEASDPRAIMEVPFWSWKDKHEKILNVLHKVKDDDDLLFSYPLLHEILPYCRCFIGGQWLEIEPVCPPTDLIRSFSKAKRRIYMTATLSDDTVLVTHFGANPKKLPDPIVPVSSQFMGERMILMPQELNPDIEIPDIRKMLVGIAKKENVVVIVPSKAASEEWAKVADQVLLGDKVTSGIEKLRNGHVGLTILINRYDGIDLPGDACRVLALVDLPEVSSFREASDMNILADSKAGLRRQMQRIEQGMGRGVRSNDDYCVVLLCGTKLTSRIKSPDGRQMLTGATQAQLELSTSLAKQLDGTDISGLKKVIQQCLDRDAAWVKVAKKALLKAKVLPGLSLDPIGVGIRESFDQSRINDHPAAVATLRGLANSLDDDDAKAFALVRQAEVAHHIDPANAQKVLLAAHKLNQQVLKPIEGVAYQKLTPIAGKQAATVQDFHRNRFLEATDRILHFKSLVEDLKFEPDTNNAFESAVMEMGRLLGMGSQRPEISFEKGPDNLLALSNGEFIVIECKNGATSEQGISKTDLGQLGQAVDWFEEKYTKIAPKHVLIIHPLKYVGPGAAVIEGARVMTEKQLEKLRNALLEFAKALGDANVLNDVQRIGQLLTTHSFTPSTFLQQYSVPMKQNKDG